eukprot:7380125-Prymnesium_polylepis.2
MPRLPMSSKAPPSARDANDAAIKSADRLLSTACSRVVSSKRAAPTAKAELLRELQRIITPIHWSRPIFCCCPAVPTVSPRSHCAYSTALRPTPPAAACTMMPWSAHSAARSSATWVVLQVIGSVHACSNDRVVGRWASKERGARASDASGACARPKTASPGRTAVESPPVKPAESAPGGPGSPGYSPSTLSTSRKFRPTARTDSSTSSGATSERRGKTSMKRLPRAPRA